jgi:hypothetical protein
LRAAESFLRYSFHQDYRSGNQINLKQETNVAVVEKTMTEELRMKLIEQREKTQTAAVLPAKPEVIEASKD